ncbi:MAG: DUF2723 domain-containing protein [Cyclobacteriaceae bacterium]|nr:DUF2723 domain-containing protein [Cyclobacteriaceae bacterium]
MNFQKINNIAGWSVFALATLVYLLTAEETASFWDCGEFIAVSYKLMVPHPPGAPFFMLIGRMFSFFAFGDVESVAYWINMVSVLSSSFSILFLFWTIVLFGRKIMGVRKIEDLSQYQAITLILSAAVGALVYTFSDTFWFSAVEAEVYAMSSFFTAIVVWAILKWDLIDDESKANRWLIFIAYMMGLSIGVHLLNLVTIPALGLIYYYKKFDNITKWGVVATFIVSGAIIILINFIIIPGLPSVAGLFEITFVNSFGLPFGSGAVFFVLLIVGALFYGIMYSIKKGNALLNTALLGLTFVLIGYSSYSIIVIRSNYNPPIDENNPEDVMSFVKFLKREQYGSRPLFYGQYFNARPVDTKEGSESYRKGETKYEVSDRSLSYVYPPNQMTIMPRIYSTDPNHQRIYRQKLGLGPNDNPTFFDNIYYMVTHQMGKMYFRYFLWNFAGRESDIKDASYMTPWDSFEELPAHLKDNKGRNNYFMLPLFIGLLGMFYQYYKDKKNFAVVGLLFFLTGLALILYLNGPPIEPRERDYIYVGSYYAFAIWVGFAVIAFSDFLSGFIKNPKASLAIATAFCVVSPAIMAHQNWDDHNRSNRFYSVDSAKNFLASCAPNAILFTGGDNDTFPLWYAQEVEGFRTDVRVVVLSYSNTDWYINQMREKMYESEPFPLSLTPKNYQQGGLNDYLMYEDMGVNNLDVDQFLKLIREDHKLLKQPGRSTNVLPSKILTLKVDKEQVLNSGIIPKKWDSLVVDRMIMPLKQGQNAIEKNSLLLLDILATNDWERPIYLNNTSRQQINYALDPYLVQEGHAYRLLPVENPIPRADMVNTELMYENMMENFHYRELDNPNTYYSEDYRDFAQNLRLTFTTLVEALINEGDREKARKVLLYCLERIPDEAIPYDVSTYALVDYLLQLDEQEKAREMAEVYSARIIDEIDYYIDRGATPQSSVLQRNMAILSALQSSLLENGEKDLADKLDEAYQESIRKMGGGIGR